MFLTVESPTPSPAFGALRHTNFRLFITGQLVSLIGTWIQQVALGWLVLELTNSAFAVGAVTAAGTLPVLLFTLHGGAIADRVNKRRAILWLQSLMAVEALLLAVLTFRGWITLPWILVLAGSQGLFSAYEIPFRQAFLMDLVGREDLMNAIALNSSAFNLSRVFGPALAGVLTAAFGPAICFLLNAISFGAVLIGLARIRLPAWQVAEHRERPTFRVVMAYLWAPGWPRTLVTLTIVFTIFALSFVTILPVYARDVLGTGAGGYGALTSAFGIGAAAGALGLAAFGRRWRRDTPLWSGVVVGLSLLGIALIPSFPIAFVLLVAGGVALAASAITTNTLLQTEAPDHLRGRVIGVYAFIVVGLAPFGSIQAGWLAEHLGVPAAVGIGGTIVLVMTLWMWRGHRPRRADARHPVAETLEA